jgi:CheY-like chemotaxis protein
MSARILALLESGDSAVHVIDSLELSKYEIVRCTNFTEAITILKGEHNIDLIISEVHLQNGGNIYDFMRWVRDNPSTKDVPFVLFSLNPSNLAKYLEDGTRTTARLLGANRYISMETFDSASFRRQIASHLPDEIQ